MNNATCSSGQAGGQGAVYFCDQTQPPGATPQGTGFMCYNTSDFCLQGPNGCGGSPQQSGQVVNGTLNATSYTGGFAFTSAPVPVPFSTLQSGSAACAFDGFMYYSCSDNVTATALLASGVTYNVSNLIGALDPGGSNFIYSLIPATTPGGFAVNVGDVVGSVTVSGGVVSIMAGLYCQCVAPHASPLPTCLPLISAAPRADPFSAGAPNRFDVVTCSAGEAGPLPSSNWFCSTDYPSGSALNGASELCYDSALVRFISRPLGRPLSRTDLIAACVFSPQDCVNGPNACGAAQVREAVPPGCMLLPPRADTYPVSPCSLVTLTRPPAPRASRAP